MLLSLSPSFVLFQSGRRKGAKKNKSWAPTSPLSLSLSILAQPTGTLHAEQTEEQTYQKYRLNNFVQETHLMSCRYARKGVREGGNQILSKASWAPFPQLRYLV